MSILNNAIESIQVGVEDYLMKDSKRYLSAVRNICAGILLLYKEKLFRLSPDDDKEVLIKKKIIPVQDDKSEKIVFRGEGRNTVGVQEIKERFKSFRISVDWKKFDELNQLRNNIEHYYTDKSPDVVREVIANSFILIRDFISNSLNEEPHQLLGEDCWQRLLKTADVYQAEEEACRKSFEKLGFEPQITEQTQKNIRCPSSSCYSNLIKAQNATHIFPSLSCCSCGKSFELNDAVEKVPFHDYETESNIPYCKNCESNKYVVKLGNKWTCFSCHTVHNNVDYCRYCHTLIVGDLGDLGDTYLLGCFMCEGQMGHYMNSRAYAS